jgi:3-methylfumaryl-CoA hydratase
LIATLLQGFAARCRAGATMESFDFRGMAPLFVDRPFHLEAKAGDAKGVLDVWARGPDGEMAMSASARFAI